MTTRTAIVSLSSASGLTTGGDIGDISWFQNAINRYGVTVANIVGSGAEVLGGDRLFVWLIYS